jgi:hypothetical protein
MSLTDEYTIHTTNIEYRLRVAGDYMMVAFGTKTDHYGNLTQNKHIDVLYFCTLMSYDIFVWQEKLDRQAKNDLKNLYYR